MMGSRLMCLIFAVNMLPNLSECQINIAIAILEEAGQVNFSSNFLTSPKELSPQQMISELKNAWKKLNETKYELNDQAKNLLWELSANLADTHENMTKTLEKLYSNFDFFDKYFKKFDVFMASVTSKEISGYTELDNYFEKLLMKSAENLESLLLQTFDLSEGNVVDSTTIFQHIGKYIKEQNDLSGEDCGASRLSQGHIQNLNSVLIDVIFRGYSLLILAYKHATIRKIGNYQHTIRSAEKFSKLVILRYAVEASQAMEHVVIDILPCHYQDDVKNETYIELAGFSQGFILETEAFARGERFCDGEHPSGDDCTTDSPQCFNYECTKAGGKLNHCHHLRDESIQVCPATDPSKRYSWIHTHGYTYFGNHSYGEKCPVDPKLRNTKATGEEKDLFCFCHCERSQWKEGDIRAISYSWAESDYHSNRVITGVKFEEKNGMIHLRAQQGRILVGGMIDQASLTWMPIPDVKSSPSTGPAPVYSESDPAGSKSSIEWKVTEEFDYIADELTFNLDDILAPEGHIVVGVSLKPDYTKGSTIELEISTMEYDYMTGNLNTGHKKIITATEFLQMKNMPLDREPVKLGIPGNPATTQTPGIISPSGPHQSVKFQQTDMEKDLGQSIVPFFDIRPLKPNPAVPLVGIGIYYRGCEDCGGFIAPKLTPYDIVEFFALDIAEVDLLDSDS